MHVTCFTMVASRRLKCFALATPFCAPGDEPPFLGSAATLFGVEAVDADVFWGPVLWRAAGVGEDAPGVGDPDAEDEDVEEDCLVSGEVRGEEEELGDVGEEGDEGDDAGDCESGETGVQHFGRGGERERGGAEEVEWPGKGLAGAVIGCHSVSMFGGAIRGGAIQGGGAGSTLGQFGLSSLEQGMEWDNRTSAV